jgi:methionyl-tRNA formyltransferase
MIWIFTKQRHVEKIRNFLIHLPEPVMFQIFTIRSLPQKIEPFDLGVSYCYSRLITEPLLSTPRLGFVNFHPAPLPEYKGGDPYTQAVKDKVMKWAVTAHYMNEKYDEGKIIRVKRFPLHDPPQTREEIGALAHYFNFELFKELMAEMAKDSKTDAITLEKRI